jgi:hypothetical protein
MSTPDPLATQLALMPSVGELFRLFLSGKQLNRPAEPALWAELEKHEAAYAGLFAALGYELRVDARGFAWFQAADAGSNIGKISRHLALLFMVVFDAQANAGKALQRYTDWLINTEWLAEVQKQHQEVLDAEGLDLDGLVELLNRSASLGFATVEPAGWRLLPAVCRYLDHFEGLAREAGADRGEVSDFPDEPLGTDDLDDQETA